MNEVNPYHKPAGHYPPVVAPTPVRSMTTEQRFRLMFGITEEEFVDRLFKIVVDYKNSPCWSWLELVTENNPRTSRKEANRFNPPCYKWERVVRENNP